MKSFVILAMLMASAALAQPGNGAPRTPSEIAEPGLSYGTVDNLPLPKTILFSVSPDDIAADAEEWARRGVQAFFMDYVAREWSSDIWAKDGKPWTIGESDETFQKAKEANAVCRRIGSETFLKIAFDHCFEWFNDTAWQQAYHNFKQFAIFARDSGCTGIALDIEYVGEQYDFDWEGYSYDGYTRADLVEKIRTRMTRVIQILYDEFPDMVFLTFPEQGLSLGGVIHAAWIEEAALRGAPGGVHYCTEHTYRNPNIRYMFGHAWACNAVFDRLLSDRAKRYWQEECSIAEGIWPFGFNYQSVYEPGMPLEEFRQGYAASLMASARYNWIYSHNCREQLIGRGLDQYKGEADLQAYLDVIAKREVVTDAKYVALARELRGMRLRDYSEDLGLLPVISFAGPADSPTVRLNPASASDPKKVAARWPVALAYFRGDTVNLREHFNTQTDWMVIGPFANTQGFEGHHAVYPPETELNFAAVYDGLNGKVRWRELRGGEDRLSVDFTQVYEPTEHVCAYAACFVTSPTERDVLVKLGTNDSGKLWIGGKLVFEHAQEGTAYLDRDIVSVRLPAGTTPILLKICNGENNWGFVFRITDPAGGAIDDLRLSLNEPK
ncbi:MAG: hypothetical protein GWP08_07905 [Nitrospiraceae bacterium]|nr:hypothetical protein [Nitrospiraceae bacterium]